MLGAFPAGRNIWTVNLAIKSFAHWNPGQCISVGTGS